MKQEEHILSRMAEAVIRGDPIESDKVAQEAVNAGIDPYDAIMKGLAKGMEVVNNKFQEHEYFLPDLLVSADAMYAALNLLLPLMQEAKRKAKGTVVIGVVQGDVHDIGKNIVKAMLTASGYEVIDLGRDVPANRFVEEAKIRGADVIAMSTLMTTTILAIRAVEERLEAEGLKGRIKTIIGGAPVTEDWIMKTKSDAYGKDARDAVSSVGILIDST